MGPTGCTGWRWPMRVPLKNRRCCVCKASAASSPRELHRTSCTACPTPGSQPAQLNGPLPRFLTALRRPATGAAEAPCAGVSSKATGGQWSTACRTSAVLPTHLPTLQASPPSVLQLNPPGSVPHCCRGMCLLQEPRRPPAAQAAQCGTAPLAAPSDIVNVDGEGTLICLRASGGACRYVCGVGVGEGWSGRRCMRRAGRAGCQLSSCLAASTPPALIPPLEVSTRAIHTLTPRACQNSSPHGSSSNCFPSSLLCVQVHLRGCGQGDPHITGAGLKRIPSPSVLRAQVHLR
jgi:hypothetical protein